MDEYNEVHEITVRMAGAKMRLNAHKGNIEDCDPEQLLTFLKSEVAELEEAMKEGDMVRIMEEAGDAYNFLVGIVHQQITLYRMRK